MQPYFFPYIGYFSLIKHTDDFILFDGAQFIRHGWIERNRILKQDGDWMYIKVPLIKAPQNNLIQNTYIDNDQPWKEKIKAQLQPYKKKAPFYNDVMALVEKVFDQDYETITSLNKKCLEIICAYLGLQKEIKTYSEMNLNIDEVHAPDEWALNICLALKDVDEYWNPPGGREFFDKTKYERAGIKLKFQSPILKQYNQKQEEFIGGLSIIDVLMFNSPDEVNLMLDQYEFV